VTVAPEAIQLAPAAVVGSRTPARLFWERFRQDKAAIFGGVVVFLLILVAIAGGPIATKLTGHSLNEIVPNSQDEFGIPVGPGSGLWLGADASGKDLFVGVMYGARTSLIVGLLATAFAVFIGTVVGLTAGYFGGWTDTFLSRSADVLLAVPQLLIAVGMVAACSVSKQGCLGGAIKPGLTLVIIVITVFSWSYIARIVRGITLSLREKEFVEAARSLGATNVRIITKEILPNLTGPIIVYSTLLIPTNILFEAALSYLGLGIEPPQTSWGQILSQTQNGLYTVAWWLMVFPGVALVLTTLAFNLLGDGLRDALDVRSER
jgi:ABC-type dipeptide/oligopeptide/nickel transport system permease subunit